MLTARWTDATHSFEGWSGDCSGAGPTCALTMDADKTVQANFESRCPTSDDPGCIVAVYEGAPNEYATVAEILPTCCSSRTRRAAFASGRAAK